MTSQVELDDAEDGSSRAACNDLPIDGVQRTLPLRAPSTFGKSMALPAEPELPECLSNLFFYCCGIQITLKSFLHMDVAVSVAVAACSTPAAADTGGRAVNSQVAAESDYWPDTLMIRCNSRFTSPCIFVGS